MYGPEDDSYLLEKYVKKFARGRILDIGCGSGILMKAALTKSKNVFGVDIDDESLEFCKRQGLNVKKSDLFSALFHYHSNNLFQKPFFSAFLFNSCINAFTCMT